MQRKPQLVAALLLVGAGCAVVLALAGRHPAAAMLQGAGTSGSAAVPGPDQAGRFTIGGAVGGLYPGGSRQLVLVVANPQHFAIVVTSIQTTVKSPSSGCSGSYLAVSSFSGQLRVAAGGSAFVSVPVTLSHAAPDACQGALFPLSYIGSARKA